MIFFDNDGRYKKALDPTSENSGILYSVQSTNYKHKGFGYTGGNYPALNKEMKDYTLSDVYKALRKMQNDPRYKTNLNELLQQELLLANKIHSQDCDLDHYLPLGRSKWTFSDSYWAGFTLLVGAHYDLGLKGKVNHWGGQKGALDFLIFPLIARKLIADLHTFDNLGEQAESIYAPLIALSIKKPVQMINTLLSLVIALPLEVTRFVLGAVLAIPLAIYFHISANPEQQEALAEKYESFSEMKTGGGEYTANPLTR